MRPSKAMMKSAGPLAVAPRKATISFQSPGGGTDELAHGSSPCSTSKSAEATYKQPVACVQNAIVRKDLAAAAKRCEQGILTPSLWDAEAGQLASFCLY